MDTKELEVQKEQVKQLSNIKHLSQEGTKIHIELEHEVAEIIFFKEDIVRIYLDPTGEFVDDTEGTIRAQTEEDFRSKCGVPQVSVVEEDDYYKVASK